MTKAKVKDTRKKKVVLEIDWVLLNEKCAKTDKDMREIQNKAADALIHCNELIESQQTKISLLENDKKNLEAQIAGMVDDAKADAEIHEYHTTRIENLEAENKKLRNSPVASISQGRDVMDAAVWLEYSRTVLRDEQIDVSEVCAVSDEMLKQFRVRFPHVQ